jgi:hypothetical protein
LKSEENLRELRDRVEKKKKDLWIFEENLKLN